MRRRLLLASLLALHAVAVARVEAQASPAAEAVLRRFGGGTLITNPTMVAPKDLVYKVVWDVNVGAAKPDSVVDGFRRPASFLLQMDDNGVPRKNVHLAIIVYGTAAQSLLDNAAYKARTGAENASIPLLEALHAAGVRIIICGEAVLGRNIPRAQLLPFVEVATTATTARAILAAQGYATFWP